MRMKIVLVLLIATVSYAAEFESQIARVTVYPGIALVERQGSYSFKAGFNRLAVTDLPAALIDESVRVRLTSGSGLSLSEVNVEKWFLTQSEEGQIHQLEEAILDLERQIKLIEGEQKSLAAKEKFLQSIQATSTSATGQTSAVIRPDAASWNSTLSFIGSNLNKIYSDMVTLEAKSRELSAEKEALEKQLAEVQSARPKEEKSVELSVQAEKAGSGQITLSYLVTDVYWRPVYEIQALPGEGKTTLHYSALVNQKTGEDWQEVELALSTAQPALGAMLPELQPWDVHLWEQARASLHKVRNAEVGVLDIRMDKDEEELSMPAPQVAAVESKSASVLFAIPGVRNIASGEEPVKVLILQNTFEVRMNYVTIPKLSAFVYLQGKMVNETLYPLLSGDAMIYVDGDYVGKTQIRPLAPGESTDLSLGIDEGIKVKRELVKKYERTKGTLSKKRELEYDYKIVIENYKKQAVEVKVVDQLPRPQQEAIEVGDVKLTPEPGEWDKEKQQVSWLIQLKAGEKNELGLQFFVSYPRDARVIGLD